MSNVVPKLPTGPIVDANGRVSISWRQFLQNNQDAIYAAARLLLDATGPLQLNGAGATGSTNIPATGFWLDSGDDISSVLSNRTAILMYSGSIGYTWDVPANIGPGLYLLQHGVGGFLMVYAIANGITYGWNGSNIGTMQVCQSINPAPGAIANIWRIT